MTNPSSGVVDKKNDRIHNDYDDDNVEKKTNDRQTENKKNEFCMKHPILKWQKRRQKKWKEPIYILFKWIFEIRIFRSVSFSWSSSSWWWRCNQNLVNFFLKNKKKSRSNFVKEQQQQPKKIIDDHNQIHLEKRFWTRKKSKFISFAKEKKNYN